MLFRASHCKPLTVRTNQFNTFFIIEENDTDLETDRLLGQQRIDDQGFYDDKVIFNFQVIKFILVGEVTALQITD